MRLQVGIRQFGIFCRLKILAQSQSHDQIFPLIDGLLNAIGDLVESFGLWRIAHLHVQLNFGEFLGKFWAT